MSSFSRWFRSERLKNTGSLARDLLAGERTFLAWTRTGLGFIALGVALEKVRLLCTFLSKCSADFGLGGSLRSHLANITSSGEQQHEAGSRDTGRYRKSYRLTWY